MVQELNFQAYQDRLPPQNIDAEESILGGILLDPEAINRVADFLRPEAFYLSAHQEIYRTMLLLQSQGNPTDLISVTSWLKDQGRLERMGGQGKLVQLIDRTVSAVNIDQYALLVMDKYTRRQLIRAGNEIAQLGHDSTADLEQVLDQSEQKVFSVTQDRPQDGLTAAADILTHAFSDIESRSLGMVLPGLSCGFYDLDAMTQGFQRSDLIIVAGRPSMGKTAICLNMARNVAAFHKLPVAVFSLEMSKEQLIQRLLASEVRIESGRLRAGRVSQQEWEPLGHAINVLSQLPMYIDDTPNISITEIRSKARRLQAEHGSLGLILLDYLQLMEGGSDNRVQELSRITRALKGLARELNVPIIALSQLSRGVESRTNKRPMMSDLRECVTGDTLVVLSNGQRVPIADLVGQQPEVVSLDGSGKLIHAQSDLVWKVGRKPVYEVKLFSGKTIRATASHRLYSFDGWREVKDLAPGDRLGTARHLPEPATTPFKFAPSRQTLGQYAALLESPALTEIAVSDLFWDQIQSIEFAGEEEVYDLTVPGPASWLADGIVSHNSGAIEQDADLIMMLYRDEYYNPDTPDRGIAEVIISKHRNGPTGVVKLLFESQFTQFRNMASPNRS